MDRHMFARALVLASLPCWGGVAGAQGPGEVLAEKSIPAELPGVSGPGDANDLFGSCLARLGDLDGNGSADLLVGMGGEDDGASNSGSLWVLFMDGPCTLVHEQEISRTQGSLTYPLPAQGRFGSSVAVLGDQDGDGMPEIAVGIANSDLLIILSLLPDGTVLNYVVPTVVGVTASDAFGASMTRLGDLDGDGVEDLFVGSPLDDHGGSSTGSCYVVYLNSNGTAKASKRITHGQGGLPSILTPIDQFGQSVAWLGDLEGDGTVEVAVGAPGDDTGGTNRGSVYMLSLDPMTGDVVAWHEINDVAGNFFGVLDNDDGFGYALAAPGDLDDDGVPDLAVGASGDDDGGADHGAIWILFLEQDGTVKGTFLSPGHVKLGDIGANGDGLGMVLAAMGDWDGDDKADLGVGLPLSEIPGIGMPQDTGSVLLLSLEGACEDGAAVSRNAVANPASLTVTAPALGSSFTATVDLLTTGHTKAFLMGFAGALQFTLAGGQVLLVDVGEVGGEILGQPFKNGPVAIFDLPVPNDPALCGFAFSIQAVHFETVVPFALSNAYDVTVGG